MAAQKEGPPSGRPPANPGTAPPPPPPKTKPKQQSAAAAFQAYVKAHPKIKPYSQLLSKWASVYGVDPVYLAALILFESGGNRNAVSSADALGLAQIHMPTWAGKQTPWGETITREWATNPAKAVRFAAWYFGRQLQAHGSYDAAYRKGYNPGYTGAGPFTTVPKTYTPTGTGLSPEEEASVSVETAAAKQAITDPWVTVKKGKVGFVKGDQPPKNALLVDGLPITRSQFLNAKRQLEETWISYTGKRPSDTQIAGFLQKGWSQYTLVRALAKTPEFYKSPVWKQSAPGWRAVFESVYGRDAYDQAEHRDLVKKAIIDNLNETAFVQLLRERPDYTKSNEFKQRKATLGNVYQTIYGTPDEGAQRAVEEAAITGWEPDQFAGWLRSRPQYSSTPEYQSKALAFLGSLGLITGDMPVLRPGEAPPNAEPGGFGPLPDDERIEGQGELTRPSGLVAGFGDR